MFNLGTIVRWIVGIALIAFLLFCLSLTSCKSVQPQIVTQTNVHSSSSDSVRSKYIHDTTFIDRWHTRFVKGDTVYIQDSTYMYKGKTSGDTLYIDNSTHDTIPQTIYIEKPQSAGSKFLHNSGIALWVIIGIVAIAMIVGIILKFAK